MRRRRGEVALALAAAVVALAPATPARAATPAVIQRYAATGEVQSDGSLQAVVDIQVQGAGGPGPSIPLPQRDEVDGDTTHWRPLEITNLTLRSSSGAPSDTQLERTDAALILHIAPRGPVSGEQHYVLSYTVAPSLENTTASAQVVRWPLLAAAHSDAIRGISATLQGPGSLSHLFCTAGSATCTRQLNQGGRSAEFEQTELASGQAFRVGVDFAPLSLQASPPALTARDDGGVRAGLRTTAIIAAVVAVVMLATGIAVRRAARRRTQEAKDSQEAPSQKGSRR